MAYVRDTDILETIKASPDRPILLARGCVLTQDATLGDWADAGILLGPVIFGVGPGFESAAEDDGMIIVDCSGCVVMPAKGGTLVPGEPSDIRVYRLADPTDASAEPQPDRPGHLDVQLVAGRPVVWGGQPVAGEPTQSVDGLILTEVDPQSPRVGLWSDERNWLRQRLLPNGRYDEARGDRESAYLGRYWITGDRIDYLDDTGFWAVGTFVGDRLEHVTYVLTRSD